MSTKIEWTGETWNPLQDVRTYRQGVPTVMQKRLRYRCRRME